ncbi:DUF3891 family protein [Candidatus Gracilibacteria bacterium]|nr:DUF3891 family protein [Candidatus Gracilibacteria bacterium]
MIVNPTAEGWEIIYHRSHALLAAQIALQWHNVEREERIAETITAIAQHDDLECEWEGDHLSSVGAPLDFTLTPKNLAAVDPWRQLITEALYRGRWVALLTAMHVQFLNAPYKADDRKLASFLADLDQQIAQWRKELKISKKEAEQSYAFLQWCDRLSLILCGRALPEHERWLEIANGPDGRRYDIMQRADRSLVVEPWPFREQRFVVAADACYLNQLQFTANAELTRALKAAPISSIYWEFSRSPLGQSARTTAAPASEG